jgi:hypothetical protein
MADTIDVEALLKKLTNSEKVDLLAGNTLSLSASRLGFSQR